MCLMIEQTISFAQSKNMMFNMHNQNDVMSFIKWSIQLFNYDESNILNQVELNQEYVLHASSIDDEGSPSLP